MGKDQEKIQCTYCLEFIDPEMLMPLYEEGKPDLERQYCLDCLPLIGNLYPNQKFGILGELAKKGEKKNEDRKHQK
ncbi:hypothetical protein [Fictibacillus sp. NRS-1165]|uniref:hypothetical protein n=1 Tax=Fictibacillus sp. NRS-1165 TaxID=3144463 RepID=UPI003D1F6FD7